MKKIYIVFAQGDGLGEPHTIDNVYDNEELANNALKTLHENCCDLHWLQEYDCITKYPNDSQDLELDPEDRNLIMLSLEMMDKHMYRDGHQDVRNRINDLQARVRNVKLHGKRVLTPDDHSASQDLEALSPKALKALAEWEDDATTCNHSASQQYCNDCLDD